MTTRARPEAASAMHDLLETGLQDGPDVGVTLTRTGKLLFYGGPRRKRPRSRGPGHRAHQGDGDGRAGQPLSGRIPIPELGLVAMVRDDGGTVSAPACAWRTSHC